MHTRPMPNKEPENSVLQICSARAAAEIERLNAENNLRESEERFHATFNQVAVGLAHVAPDGRYLRLNLRFCDIVGYANDELLQLTFQDIIIMRIWMQTWNICSVCWSAKVGPTRWRSATSGARAIVFWPI